MSEQRTVDLVQYPIQCDVEALKASFAHLSVSEKRVAVYLLLHSLLGDRPEHEDGIYDPEGFAYMCLVPPGKRAYFRTLEDPGWLERLQKASTEESFPIEQIRKELGMLDQ